MAYQKESAWEFRRRRAIELIEDGEPVSLVARVLDISADSIRRWRRIAESGGSLKDRKTSGRPRSLTDSELSELEQLLLQGPIAHGWHNSLWTTRRVRAVIRRHFNREYSHSHTWTILTEYLGWTLQRPAQQLREPADVDIEGWKKDEYPRILRDAFQRHAHVVFIDETGFMLAPTVRRTFAPRGQTPIFKVSDPHERISMIGAIAISPRRAHCSFHYQLFENSHIYGGCVRDFLNKLARRVSRPITVLWDSIPIHRCKTVWKFLDSRPSIWVEYFPPYAGSINPVDKAWFYLKYQRLPNYAPQNHGDLKKRLVREVSRIVKKSDLLHSFVRHAGLTLDFLEPPPF